jgi:hypothetical protein
MDLFDTLTWAEILEKTTFLGTPTLIVLLEKSIFNKNNVLMIDPSSSEELCCLLHVDHKSHH